jgi:hypothetical protein
MEGEKNLTKMLEQLNPRLEEGEYIFCSVPVEQAEQLVDRAAGWFNEQEGVTLILKRSRADAQNLGYGSIFRKITLTVHSSLTAVGLLAEVTGALAQAGLSVNVISGFFHDHLFIEKDAADQALSVLLELSQSSRKRY